MKCSKRIDVCNIVDVFLPPVCYFLKFVAPYGQHVNPVSNIDRHIR